MTAAADRVKNRDTLTLTYLKAHGPATMRDARAYLHELGSFSGSTSRNSMETLTRSSIKRLESRGLVEHVGKGGATGLAYLYAAKGTTESVAEIARYRSKLTRAEFDAIIAIEAVMAKQDCDGMFARDGGALPEALADSMEAAGWLSSQWMEGYIEDEPHGGAAYWPTANGRLLRGMCVGAELRGREVVFAETPTVSSALMVARELAKNWGPLPMWLDAEQREALFAWVRRQAEEPGGDIVATIGARLRLPEPAAVALCSAALAPAPTEPGPW